VRISEAGSVLIFGEEEDVLVIEKFCTGRVDGEAYGADDHRGAVVRSIACCKQQHGARDACG
jgi:hypothetical protein